MILDSQCSPDKGLDEHALDPEMLVCSLTHKEELRRLKLKLGSWSLAPQLVTAETMWKQLLIVTLVRPSWTSHAKQAREVKTAQEVQDYTAANALGGWAQELFALIDNGFHGLEKLYSGHRYTADNEQACLDMHFSFLRLLLSNRAQSLASCYMLPPNRYAGALTLEQRELVLQQMAQEWGLLLKGEAFGADALQTEHSGPNVAGRPRERWPDWWS